MTPPSSISVCGASAPQDTIGQGALQLTPRSGATGGMVVATTPVATAAGLQITFTDYSFDGTTPAVTSGEAFVKKT